MPGSAERPWYSLAAHVYACRTDDYIVLLDLDRNEYIGVDLTGDLHPNWMEELVVRGFTDKLPNQLGQVDTSSDSRLCIAAQLFDAGMLTVASRPTRNARRTLTQPTSALIDGYCGHLRRIDPMAVMYVTAAIVTARLMLYFLPLKQVVARIARRAIRSRKSHILNTDLAKWTDSARHHVLTFRHLCPYFYSPYGACLLDSLALLEYLSYYALYPQWVFGVTTTPFSAHCWLQHEDIVLNDDPSLVRRFTPIMVV